MFSKGFHKYKNKALATLHALFDKRVSIGGIIKAILLLVVVSVVVTGPLFRTPDYQLLKLGDWGRALSISWLLILGTVVLRHIDRLRATKPSSSQAKARRLSAATAMDEIRSCILAGKYDEDSMLRSREHLLECVSMKVAEIIQEKDPQKVVASLVTLCDGDRADSMCVIARSLPYRKAKTYYKKAALIAWEAIKKGRVVLQHDIRKDSRFQSLERTYRTVFAVPVVTNNGKALASISIDHPRPYAFVGYGLVIEECLQPYISGFLLTYPENAVSISCRYDRANPVE